MGIGNILGKFKNITKIGKIAKKGISAPKKVVGESSGVMTPPGYYPGINQRSYSGSGVPTKGILIFVLVLVLLGGTLFAVFFTPLGTFFRAPAFQFQNSAGGFLGSYGIRKMMYQLSHPFSVQPTEAQTEQTNQHYEPVQAIAENLKVSATVIPDTVEVDNTPYSIYIHIVNTGTDTVNRLWVLLTPKTDDDYSRNAFGGGLSHASIDVGNIVPLICNKDQLCSGSSTCNLPLTIHDPEICSNYEDEDASNFLLFEYNAPLQTGSSIAIPISNLKIVQGALSFSSDKIAIPFYVKVFSLYTAASRLPLTFINNNYATLLYQMNKFHYMDVPATAMAGTAVKINLDAGQQPISSNTHKLVTLISFENVGNGKLLGSPLLVLVLPKEVFTSPCQENYYLCITDKYRASIFEWWLCSSDSSINQTLGGYAHKELSWVCNLARNYKTSQYYVCVTKVKKQFSTYACTANINVNMMGSKRQTYYMTAFAIYPYMYQVPLMVNAYKLGDSS